MRSGGSGTARSETRLTECQMNGTLALRNLRLYVPPGRHMTKRLRPTGKRLEGIMLQRRRGKPPLPPKNLRLKGR